MQTGDNKPHKCDVCGEGFSRVLHLQMHTRTHTEEDMRPFKCDECGQDCINSRHLKRHIERRHTVTTGKHYKCPCGQYNC